MTKALILMLIPCLALAEDMQMLHGKGTDPVALITRRGDIMQANHVKVEHVVGGTPLICFRQQHTDSPLVACFVVNDETGEVKLVNLAPNETIT